MTLIARLRIILNDVDPQPMRQIEVPLKIRLDRLHEVVQAAMGWTDTHLYEFHAGGAGWGVPDPDGFYDGPMPAKKATRCMAPALPVFAAKAAPTKAWSSCTQAAQFAGLAKAAQWARSASATLAPFP